MFVLAEVTASAHSIQTLCHHPADDADVIVARDSLKGNRSDDSFPACGRCSSSTGTKRYVVQ
jgi:hypothetical protein